MRFTIRPFGCALRRAPYQIPRDGPRCVHYPSGRSKVRPLSCAKLGTRLLTCRHDRSQRLKGFFCNRMGRSSRLGHVSKWRGAVALMWLWFWNGCGTWQNSSRHWQMPACTAFTHVSLLSAAWYWNASCSLFVKLYTNVWILIIFRKTQSIWVHMIRNDFIVFSGSMEYRYCLIN
jgi:hypothetical protein